MIKYIEEVSGMEITEVLYALLDAYAYEIVFVDREHIVRYMNKVAKERYKERVQVGRSLFHCHNENSKKKIEEFLSRADQGEEEMFELLNGKTGEREFFVPVRNKDGEVIGYFERHEAFWSEEYPEKPVFEYWKNRK